MKGEEKMYVRRFSSKARKDGSWLYGISFGRATVDMGSIRDSE
jgi:hypothetical protein